MLVRIEIFDKIWVAEIQNYPMERVAEDDIIVPVGSFADFESVTFLLILLDDVVEWHAQWREGGCINLVAHLL